jgi:GT2 family glycosyltransferase
MQQVRPRIDFNEIEFLKVDPLTRFNIVLHQGTDLSSESLHDCKEQLDSLSNTNVSVRIARSSELDALEQVRTLGVLIDSPVRFRPRFLDFVINVFTETDTTLMYSDFENEDEGSIESIALPAWSPVRFESIDFLGPVIIFDPDRLHLDPGESLSRDKIVSKCNDESQRVSRLPRISYSCKGWRGKRRSLAISNSRSDLISIVIPTRGVSDELNSLLERCTNSLNQQSVDSGVEVIIVVDSGFELSVVQNSMNALPSHWKSKLIEFKEPFNFSKKCNIGANEAAGDVLVFLNDDVELISRDALAVVALSAKRKNVGAIGSTLKFSDGSIQHGGITLQNVKPRNSFLDQFPHPTFTGDLEVSHEVSAVTGACLAISKSNFDMCGGWNEELHNSYNDVDLCLRLHKLGLQTIVRNDLEILHHESVSRDSSFDEESFEMLKLFWPDELGNELYLRLPIAQGIGYQGKWGINRESRVDLSGRHFRYLLHLLKTQGFIQTVNSVFRRVTGKTANLLRFQSKSYL